MPLDFCKTHLEARQSTRESMECPRYKPQEQSSMIIKERMHVNEIKKGKAFNNWRTGPKQLGQDEGNCLLTILLFRNRMLN